jgi:hypothetical protein
MRPRIIKVTKIGLIIEAIRKLPELLNDTKNDKLLFQIVPETILRIIYRWHCGTEIFYHYYYDFCLKFSYFFVL